MLDLLEEAAASRRLRLRIEVRPIACNNLPTHGLVSYQYKQERCSTSSDFVIAAMRRTWEGCVPGSPLEETCGSGLETHCLASQIDTAQQFLWWRTLMQHLAEPTQAKASTELQELLAQCDAVLHDAALVLGAMGCSSLFKWCLNLPFYSIHIQLASAFSAGPPALLHVKNTIQQTLRNLQ